MANRAIKDQEDRTVEVDRLKLVATLRANRIKHKAEYEEAIAGYVAMGLEKLSESFEDAKVKLEVNFQKGQERIKAFDPAKMKLIAGHASDYLTLVDAIQLHLKVPRDFSDEYDAAIDMAQWDVRETLELTHAEFQCFVRDVWDWTNEFAVTTAMYMSKK